MGTAHVQRHAWAQAHMGMNTAIYIYAQIYTYGQEWVHTDKPGHT